MIGCHNHSMGGHVMKLAFTTSLLAAALIVLSCAISIDQASIQSSQVNTTTVVKGIFNQVKGEITTGGKKDRRIHLKKSGRFFTLPIYVGTAVIKSEKRHPEMRKYHVKLDVASENTLLFSDQVWKDFQKHGALCVFTRTNKMVYNFFKPQKSSTYQIIRKRNGRAKVLSERQLDGSIMYADMAFDAFEVAGMRMPEVEFALVTAGSSPQPKEPKSPRKHIDITGFDGTLGLGLGLGKDMTDKTGPRSLWNAMKKSSKAMGETEIISIYICSDGQAGQLELGGVDKRLLATGSEVKYAPIPSVEGKYPHWAVNLMSVKRGTQTIEDNIRVAIIDSAHPYISAPKEDIDHLFQSQKLWPKNVMLTSQRERTECDIMKTMHKPQKGCATIWEPSPHHHRNAPMVLCSLREEIGTLTLQIWDYSVSFTGMEMFAEEVEDQDTYPGMCELFFDISPSSEWRLGVPFLQKAGMTVLDKKTMHVGFAPVRHSEKVCGPIKKSTT